jgi:hypothetical protein
MITLNKNELNNFIPSIIIYTFLLIILILNCKMISCEKNSNENFLLQPKPFPHLKRPLILSHRGSRFLTPENTMTGFKNMLSIGKL